MQIAHICLIALSALFLSGTESAESSPPNATTLEFLRSFEGEWVLLKDSNPKYEAYLRRKGLPDSHIPVIVGASIERSFALAADGKLSVIEHIHGYPRNKSYEGVTLGVALRRARFHYQPGMESITFTRQGHMLMQRHQLDNHTTTELYGFVPAYGQILNVLYYVPGSEDEPAATRTFVRRGENGGAAPFAFNRDNSVTVKRNLTVIL